MSNSEKLQLQGLWSLVALFFLLLAITMLAGVGYEQMFTDIGNLVSGGVDEIASGKDDVTARMVVNIVAVVLVNIVLSYLVAILFLRNKKGFDKEALRTLIRKGPAFFFGIIILEELLTRGFFLGVLNEVFPGKTAFYILFLVGNGLWAGIHIFNWRNKSERNMLMVLPQFISGICFTYVYVHYGIMGSILAHMIFNGLVVTSMKEKVFDEASWVSIGYYMTVGVVVYIAMSLAGGSLSDISPWLNDSFKPLAEYGFLDYLLLLLLIDCIFILLANLAGLDATDVDRQALEKYGTNVFYLLFGSLLVVLFVLGLNWVLSLVTDDVITRAILVSLILATLNKTGSGSAMSRVITTSLPTSFVTVAAFTVLGFWSLIGLILFSSLVHLVPRFVESRVQLFYTLI